MPPQSSHAMVTSSTNGRCRSSSVRSWPARTARSVTDRTHVSWPQSVQRQTGIGVPQKRSRESAQSTLFASQSPKRPWRMCSGCQPICSFSRRSASLCSDVRANHVGLAQ